MFSFQKWCIDSFLNIFLCGISSVQILESFSITSGVLWELFPVLMDHSGSLFRLCSVHQSDEWFCGKSLHEAIEVQNIPFF